MHHLSASEAGRQLGVSRNAICALIKSGVIPAFKRGKYWQIDPADIEARRWMSTAEVAREFNFPPATIRWNIRRGNLVAKKFGHHYRIQKSEVEKWLKKR